MARSYRLPLACLGLVAAVFLWSAVGPFDRATWWMEVAPVLIIAPILILTARRFPLTRLAYLLIALHAVILTVGGHYTYARVPFFDEIGALLGTGRNSYDGLGHFAQGFVPALVARELLLRTSPLRPGKWLSAVIVLSCLGISAIYELVEWAAAVLAGGAAEDFLGTQGDPWDTQKDMALCGIGAACALLALSRLHDRQLSQPR
jgi:putative membrane protein